MKEITKKVTTIDSTFETTELISSTTTEYPDKVKVISLFKDDTTKQVQQVVSIFDKKTSKVEII